MLRYITNVVVTTSCILSLIACKKDSTEVIKGCRDTSSLNYNVAATVDDGSCRYVADQLIGSYRYNDTTTFNSGNGNSTSTTTGTLLIAKSSNSNVSIVNFNNCSDQQMATVTLTSFSVTAASNCYAISRFVGTVYNQGAKLRYNYDFDNAGGRGTVKGTAVKLP